jgi:hypothetical protein
MVAALKPWGDEEIKIVQKRRETEKKLAKCVYKNANLVLSHGGTTAIAPTARAHCPDTASRIIRKRMVSEDRVLCGLYRGGADLCADEEVLGLRAGICLIVPPESVSSVHSVILLIAERLMQQQRFV